MQYLDARERICRSHRWPNDGCQPRSDRDVAGPKKACAPAASPGQSLARAMGCSFAPLGRI